MSTQSAAWKDTARLLRRSGFGTTGALVDEALDVGDLGGVVDRKLRAAADDPGVAATPLPDLRLIASRPGAKATSEARERYGKKVSEQAFELRSWWLTRMVSVEEPLVEKLTLLWHNHFATSLTTVKYSTLMAAQNEKIRTLCLGDFRTLAYAMLTDAATVRWLDGQSNRAGAPNENLAREFLELFALGHGNGYTERDVREGARALTGWVIHDNGTASLVKRRHDTGTKKVLRASGDLDAAGFCDAVLAHPKSARFVAGRMWQQLASDSPPRIATMSRLLDAYGSDRSLRKLTETILVEPEFYEATTTVIIGPVEWLVGLLRTLRVAIDSPLIVRKALSTLKSLGQLPFYPPSVAGWPGGQAWLSAAAAGIRLRAAADLVQEGDVRIVEEAPPGDRLDAVGYLMGIGTWSKGTAEALKPIRNNPKALIAAAANTPEYLVS